MPSLTIKWRPSGGRGEYEYKVVGEKDFLGKRIDVEVPGLGTVIKTDAHFQIKDGKPRLRRENPNDRQTLNVPPLVAAIAGLPEPRREDSGEEASLPLSDKSYVVDVIDCIVVRSDKKSLVVKPIALKPRNGEYIDIESRLAALIAAKQSFTNVATLLDTVKAGINSATTLKTAADHAHQSLPYKGDPASNSPQGTSQEPDEIIEDYVGTEGKAKIRIHRHKERDKKLIRLAKKKFKATYGDVFCECCGISFKRMYSKLGEDFIEAHHRTPLNQIKEETQTSIDDLAMLCANCHRMVHRTKDCSVDEVRQVITKNKALIDEKSVKRLLQ